MGVIMPLTEEEKKAKHRVHAARYRAKNKEKIQESNKKYREINKEALRIRSIAWYHEHKTDPDVRSRRLRTQRDCYNKIKDSDSFKEKRKRESKAYREKYKDKLLEKGRMYANKNRDKLRVYFRDKKSKDVKGLSDNYIKDLFTRKGSPLTYATIPQSLIEAKRLELQMKRFIKEQENGS
jgi:hypothetical protein